jgi:hypothetical protein
MTFGIFRTFACVAATFLLPAIPVSMLIVRVHPRLRRLLVCGVVYGAACFLAVFAVTLAVNPEIMLAPWEPRDSGIGGAVLQIVVGVALAILVFVAGFSAAFAIGAAIERFLGKHTVEQTGRVCWSCGYNLGAANITVCPECGGGFDPTAACSAKSHRLLALLLRGRTVLLVLSLIGAVAPAAFQIVAFAVPAARFLRACPKGATLQQAGMMGNYVWRPDRSGAYRSVIMPIQYGWWIPDAGAQTMGIAVQFLPRSMGDEPTMFISRACLVDFAVPAGAVIAGPVPKFQLAEPGTVRVRTRLSREQALRICQSGEVPAGLMEALRMKAGLAGWAVADAAVVPATDTKEVDPLPWFPGTRPAAADAVP